MEGVRRGWAGGVGLAMIAASGLAGAQTFDAERIETYVGISGGMSSLEQEIAIGVPGVGVTLDASGTGFKAFTGVRVGYFGLEGGYYDLGRFDDELLGVDVRARITGFNVAIMGHLPMGRVDLFGKVGLLRWEGELEIGGLLDSDDSGTDVSYGAGIAIRAGEHFSVRGEFERFDLDGLEIDFISFGIEARF